MLTEVLSPSAENLQKAALLLHEGTPVGMPTETVYGLAADAFNEDAVAKVYSFKERPKFDPLIVHIFLQKDRLNLHGLEALDLIDAQKISDAHQADLNQLLPKLWPGPLTVVLPKNKKVPDLVTAGLPTVGIRMPKHRVAQHLICEYSKPLAAPSANRFGRISPTRAEDVREELEGKLPLILDGGECEIGLESTVMGLTKEGFCLYRHGAVSMEELKSHLSLPIVELKDLKKESEAAPSPGMVKSHYAPKVPFYLLDSEVEAMKDLPAGLTEGQSIGLITLRKKAPHSAHPLTLQRSFSEAGDLMEVAKNLFATLRSMDQSGLDAIICEPCLEQKGLGHAIRDRLERAAAKRES